MKVKSLKLIASDYPDIISVIEPSPRQLFIAGEPLNKWLGQPRLAVVGSRKATPYGLGVTAKLVTDLANAGVVIISGLALGIDGAAHRAALAAGGTTVAVLPTSLQHIYPASHFNLAQEILSSGGTLISEYPPEQQVFKTNFSERNRIISGLADAVLITEAAVNSGSLVTARFGLEQGRTVMAVPGNITSASSEGCNNLIKSGAIPVTSADDVFFALNLKPRAARKKPFRGSEEEETVYNLVLGGVSDQEELAIRSGLDGAATGSVITSLELNGYIKPAGAGHWLPV